MFFCRYSVLLSKHAQCAVFSCLHDLALTRTFVVKTAEMQYTVYDNTVQLFAV